MMRHGVNGVTLLSPCGVRIVTSHQTHTQEPTSHKPQVASSDPLQFGPCASRAPCTCRLRWLELPKVLLQREQACTLDDALVSSFTIVQVVEKAPENVAEL